MTYFQQSIFLVLFAVIFGGCLNSTDSGSSYDNTADIEYLEEHAAQEGVIITDSGLQYRVIDEGEGTTPGPNSDITVHYKLSLVSGELVNSRDNNGDPQQFNIGGVIHGFGEGLQLMQEGAVYELVIPSDIGYRDEWFQGIPPGSTLIYEVELIEVL